VYIKYPRTKHLPFSASMTDDDKVIESLDAFQNERIIITIKMDGENTTMYRDFIHARSIDSGYHESRTWVKNLHSQIAYKIPKGWRVCGENLYAKHSIHYKNLPSYFMIYSIWDNENVCLDWEMVETWADTLGIPTAPVIYEGLFDEQRLQDLAVFGFDVYKGTYNGDECEGYVVRVKRAFDYNQFGNCVAKYVRENHVQTDEHWKDKPVIKNLLRR
jgi:hypothetical protein